MCSSVLRRSPCWIVVALLASSFRQPEDVLFPGKQFAVGKHPYDLVLADLNGDQRPDAVTANHNGHTISVLLGDGQGGFGDEKRFVTGLRPIALALGDLDGDDELDLVTANHFSSEISVLLGDGDGGFSAPTDFAVAKNHPISVALGDLNGDGHLDAVACSEWWLVDNVSVLLGDGHGGFSAPSSFTVNSYTWSVELGDVDEDGALDLFVVAADVKLLLGDGQGEFGPPVTVGMGNPRTLHVEDLNEDGHLDLVGMNTYADAISIRLGDGQGSFSHRKTHFVHRWPRTVATGDVNEDGRLDLAVVGHGNNGFGNSLSVFLGDGAGAFEPQAGYALCPYAVAAGMADLNGDGHLDVVATTIKDDFPQIRSAIQVLAGNGRGGFVAAHDQLVGRKSQGLAIQDVNGDQCLDVATANAVNDVSILIGDGRGALGAPAIFPVGSNPVAVVIGDFNADSRPDVVSANRYSGDVSLLLGDGQGSFGPATHFDVPSEPSSVGAGDFDTDGDLDLAVSNYGPAHGVALLMGDGMGGFGSATTLPVSYASDVVVGDWNEDSHLDLAVTLAFSDALSILLGDGQGGFAAAASVPLVAGPGSVTASDWNADGHSDLAITAHHQNSSYVIVLVGDGQGQFAISEERTIGAALSSVAGGDLDGDGTLDLVVSDHTANVALVLAGEGDGTFVPAGTYGVGQGPAAIATADLDRDGRLDLVTANAYDVDSSSVSVLQNLATPGCSIAAYGLSNPNSTGVPAFIGWNGSASLGAGDLVLTGRDLPPAVVGLFFYGRVKVDPGIPFGNGLRLVGGAVARLAVVQADEQGRVHHAMDFTVPPLDALTPADVMCFQLWYRDPAAGGAFFNTTNALEIDFCE